MGNWKHKTIEINKEEDTLTCSWCGIVSITWKKSPNGLYKPFCSVAVKEQRKASNSNSIDSNRIKTRTPYYERKSSYHKNLTNQEVKDYKKDKCCEVCGTTENLHLDHDHKTTNIRGVLCHNHNVGLGFFQDNIEYLEAAIKYLKKA